MVNKPTQTYGRRCVENPPKVPGRHGIPFVRPTARIDPRNHSLRIARGGECTLGLLDHDALEKLRRKPRVEVGQTSDDWQVDPEQSADDRQRRRLALASSYSYRAPRVRLAFRSFRCRWQARMTH